MKFWNWIKSLPWVVTAGTVITAILFALVSAKASRLTRRAEHSEATAENIVQDHTKKNIEKAAKLQKAAETNKAKAAEAKEKAEAKLKELGEKDESISDIATRFNSKRVRRSTGDSA